MKPLEPLSRLSPPSPVEQLLREAPAADVEAELGRLEGLELSREAAAARDHAAGELALRVGRLGVAREAFERAADAFASLDEEASRLSRCERWLAAMRKGPRPVYDEAAEALEALAASGSRRVRVVATHYRATALRLSGRPEPTLQVLLEAFAESDGLLVERARVLNSLGTLYVVLGAFGAAEAVLSHAAELNHQIGDRVSEAIAYGQLGSAALGRGELQAARRYLQKQEWFASRVNDAFGQARALVMLADVAIDLRRPDDAVELATEARAVAEAVDPPLSVWVAYALRTIGRAKLDVGAVDALQDVREARRRFRELGNQLGEALTAWDLAHHGEAQDAARWFEPAWALASLGLSARVAQLVADRRSAGDDDRRLHAVTASVAQSYPHLASAQEVELVLSEPGTVADIATRRIAGQRNLARLAAHAIAPRGLYLAVVAAAAIGTGIRMVPSHRSASVLVGQLPGAAVLGWAPDVGASIVARDLSSCRVSLGEDTRAVLGLFPEASVVLPPFGGELSAEIAGADLGGHVAKALRESPATLAVLPGTPWDGEAEALARMSGFNAR